MPNWEYMWVTSDPDMSNTICCVSSKFVLKDKKEINSWDYQQNMLDDVGNDGWELVCTSVFVGQKKVRRKFFFFWEIKTGTTIEFFYFKRPLVE